MSRPDPTKALIVGAVGTAVAVAGIFVSSAHAAATAWLVGIGFWTAVALGMLMMILIHHIFDSSWSVVLRRQYEHGLAFFPWLLLLFVPLLAASFLGSRDLVWPWMNPAHQLDATHTVRDDLIYVKKSGFLNTPLFTIVSVAFFGIWIWISRRLRNASFSQDLDGDARWTRQNGKTAGFGIPLVGLMLTAAAIYWFKSLEYHWFSTMYGVWYFANCMRAALSLGVLMMIWLYNRGDLKGILKTDHLWAIGQLMLTFTVFWAYVSFAQYFLIWNANVPEETFWYNIREFGDWWYVSLFLVFGNFLLPFCLLLSYRYKVTHRTISRIAYLILFVVFVDICYNILPALKDANGNPQPFFSLNLLWSLASVAGVGGICIAAYLRSFPKSKLIPIRDPRIADCLDHDD